MAEWRKLSSGWSSYEVCEKDGNGQFTVTPFSAVLAKAGSQSAPAISKIGMVQDIGWPDARDSLAHRGKRRIVPKDGLIWLLKCTPACWRLYVYVREDGNDKEIIYVRAVCKKQDKEDPEDAKKARRVADSIREGRSRILPSGSPLDEIYRTEDFKNEWANDVRAHVARNVLYLRRHRDMSQKDVATAMKTSQSAIARIESEQENITLDTLRRLTDTLGGRLYISIPPKECAHQPVRPWWQSYEPQNSSWTVVGSETRLGYQTDQAIVALERSGTLSLGAQILLEGETTFRGLI